MTASDKFYDYLVELEGLRLNAYLDSAGIPTIGIGTIRYPDGKAVKMGDTCTREQAIEYARHDTEDFEARLNKLVTGLTQNQYDALLLLMYNIGAGALSTSTVLKRIKSGEGDIREAWLRWNRAGGKVVQGLTNRREKELKIFFL